MTNGRWRKSSIYHMVADSRKAAFIDRLSAFTFLLTSKMLNLILIPLSFIYWPTFVELYSLTQGEADGKFQDF